MKKIVVTSGDKYTDIDVLACAIAYTKLLKSEGKNAEAVLRGAFNKSITDEIRKLNYDYKTEFTGADAFVIVDVSHPDYIANFVEEDKIVELYDHHSGFEKYFKKLLGNNSHIELIGAAATLIWEEFKKRGMSKKIKKDHAHLLYAAIVSNTLNLNTQNTNKRDRVAAKELLEIIKLPKNWVDKYFSDQDNIVFSNPYRETINDTHYENVPQFKDTIIIGQLELWDSRKFINNHLGEVKKALESFGKDVWFFTTPSISEGINYIYTENDDVKKLLSKIVQAKFEGDIGKTNQLWLRKEILKKMYEENCA
jgi:hypothetical protein